MKTLFRRVMLLSFIFYLSCGLTDLEFSDNVASLSPEIALPIGSISYTISDLIDDINSETLEVQEGDDFFLSLVYQDTNVYADQENFLSIDDVTNQTGFQPLDSDIPPVLPAQVITEDSDFDFALPAEDGKEIDSVYFRGGTLNLMVTSDFDFPVDYTFTLTDVRTINDDQPLVFSGSLDGANPEGSHTRDMGGTKVVSVPTAGDNLFFVNLEVTLFVPENTGVSANDGFTIDLLFDDPATEAAFGGFGMDLIDVYSSQVDVSSLNELGNGGIEFFNPILRLEIENEFGIELDLFLDDIKAITDDGEIPLEGSVTDNPQFVDSPDYEQIGQSVQTDIVIDNTNSNLADLFSSLPNQLAFDVTAQSNPAAGDNIRNFLFDTDSVTIRSIAEIPFELKMDGFQREESFSSPGGLDEADYIDLLLTVTNEIPINGTLGISFRDKDGNELFLLSGVELINSPTIGSDGRTTEAVVTNSQINLVDEALDAFLEADDIVVIIGIDSFEKDSDRFVRFYSDYELKMEVAIVGQITIEI